MNQIVSRLAIPILFGALMLSGCGGGEKTATNGGKEKAAENKTVTIGVTPEYPKKLKLVINKQAAEKQGIKLKPSFTEPSILLLDEHTAALDPARAVYPAYEQIMTHAARMRSRTRGHFAVPLVIRAPYGAGVRAPEIHSDSTEALFTHMPGIKVVCPASPYDAKGLLIAAIEDPDPVLFLEPMRSYRAFREDVPEGKYAIEIGKGKKLREGDDVTVIAWGAMVPVAMKAAEEAAKKGIDADVIDLRTLYPLDKDMIAESVQKTGRAVIVQEAHATGGLANDILAVINDTSFFYQHAPVERVTGFDVPVPFFAYEDDYLPTPSRVLHAMEKVMRF
ncbi:alpha-ketoacid dehydrogenase subunit beta [Geobacillus sp. PK12]|uniref:alpha-ketoacid dehydrogenase subunit beta n=1 Tax=Geobacillus sp. PK12 TaxID=2508525 RepID=UPI001010F518|nr:transketolase C-terminal domain-containing protein [Geobacillus sp. PK12]RXS83765.1 pyruvate dehydrogenase [Geobacillus sp. PK12]